MTKKNSLQSFIRLLEETYTSRKMIVDFALDLSFVVTSPILLQCPQTTLQEMSWPIRRASCSTILALTRLSSSPMRIFNSYSSTRSDLCRESETKCKACIVLRLEHFALHQTSTNHCGVPFTRRSTFKLGMSLLMHLNMGLTSSIVFLVVVNA